MKPSRTSREVLPRIVTDDHVAKEAETTDLGGLANLASGTKVSGARIGLAAGMVVCKSEGSPVVPKNGIQDLADRDERPVHRAIGDSDHSANSVGSIADENDHTLP